jgi:hypothetical protein
LPPQNPSSQQFKRRKPMNKLKIYNTIAIKEHTNGYNKTYARNNV